MFVVPLTVLLIFMILYTMFGSVKWAGLVLMNVAMAPVGGLLALLVTGTNFSVSSGVGFLALFGVRCRPASSCWNTSTSCVRAATDRGSRRGRRGAAASAHHDDHAGGDAGLAAGGHCRMASARIRSGLLPSSSWAVSWQTW